MPFGVPPLQPNIPNPSMYYQCSQCNFKYIGYCPERCNICDSGHFKLRLGDNYWNQAEGNPVLKDIHNR